jgi:uncharacterized membrane protein
VPADHPDQTTGAVRGRRAPGRHRTDEPAAAPQTPEVGFPAVHQPGHEVDRPRHARGGEAATHLPPEPDHNGGYDDWYGGDGKGGDHDAGEQRAVRGPGTPRGDDAYPDVPYRNDRYSDDRYDDRYAADTYARDPYAAVPDRAAPDRYPTARPDQGRYPADPYGPDPYAERPMDRTERVRSNPARAPRSRAAGNGSPDGTPVRADDRYGPPRYEPRPEDDFDTDYDADPPGRPGVRDLPPHPDQAHGDPAVPGLPSRRPGDPPGAPADLFVETTAETPALTPAVLDLHDKARAPAAPETDTTATDTPAADDTLAGDTPAGEPPGRARVFGLPLPISLPAWAERMLPTPAKEQAAGPSGGHGHGHGHGPARPAGRRVRILIAALLVPCALATLVGLVVLWPSGGPPATARPGSQEPVKAQVTATRAADCTQGSGSGGCVALVVHMTDGPRPGRDLVQLVPIEPGSPQFTVGDQVVLAWSGAEADDAGSYQVVDFQRSSPLVWLAGLFAVAVLVLGRWRGLAALAALGLSFVVLLFFVVPAILAGRDPLAVAVVGACLIMFAVLYLTHGPSARTSTAVIGTLLSLALIGALGAGFSAGAQLTGLDDQTSNLIATLGTGVDARGLLLAGVVIGALGVLDDVTVTQTSAVWELRHANPGMSARGLFAAAMRIGRDHVASAVNTLVLAYAGAALPLLLLFSLSGRGFGDIVTSQDVATEIVRTLVGSIGLVASVPITTALAAAVAARETVRPADADAA